MIPGQTPLRKGVAGVRGVISPLTPQGVQTCRGFLLVAIQAQKIAVEGCRVHAMFASTH